MKTWYEPGEQIPQRAVIDYVECTGRKHVSPYARNTDPQTSHEAAKQIGEHVQRLQMVILNALANHPLGLTTRQIAQIVEIDWGSITPRMAPLETAGWVIRPGETRKILGHRSAIVWYITGNGFTTLAKNDRQTA